MASLPPAFRRIRLELAREPEHPEGDPADGYDFIAPLDGEGRIDAALWKANRDACRVHRFRPGYDDDEIGLLVKDRRGEWIFDYWSGKDDNEKGFRFGEEHFIVGEYVSVRDGSGKMHTFRVAAVDRV